LNVKLEVTALFYQLPSVLTDGLGTPLSLKDFSPNPLTAEEFSFVLKPKTLRSFFGAVEKALCGTL
jgi:hypothetical protein